MHYVPRMKLFKSWWGRGWKPNTETKHERPARVLLLIGELAHTFMPPLELSESEDQCRVELPMRRDLEGEWFALRLERRNGIDSGTLLYRAQKGLLVGRAEPVREKLQRGSDVLEIIGVQAKFWLPAGARITREVRVVLATNELALGNRLVKLFAPPTCHAFPPALTLDVATRFLAQSLLASGRTADVTVRAPGTVCLTDLQGAEEWLSLEALWPEIARAGPAEGLKQIEAFASLSLGLEATREEPKLMLRMLPGTNATVSVRADEDRKRPKRLACRQVGDDLCAVFVQDGQESMRFLEEHEVTGPPGMFKRAQTNMMLALPIIRILGNGPVFMIVCGGNYESSLPLLPAVRERLREIIDGPILMALPTRDLFFAASDTRSHRIELETRAKKLYRGTFALRDGVYRVHEAPMWFERLRG